MRVMIVRTANDVITRVIKPKVLLFVSRYDILSRADKERRADSKGTTSGQQAQRTACGHRADKKTTVVS
jgi:hypothetical protein